MSTLMRHCKFTITFFETETFQLGSDPVNSGLLLHSSVVIVRKGLRLIIFVFFSYATRVYNFFDIKISGKTLLWTSEFGATTLSRVMKRRTYVPCCSVRQNYVVIHHRQVKGLFPSS